MTRFGAVLLAAAVLTGCGVSKLWRGEDNTQPPTPLVEFEPRVQITTLWKRDVGAGAEARYLKLTPAVAGERVFAAGHEGRVRAYDAESGETLWETDLDLPLSGGPGVGEGLVLVGTSEGQVAALEADSGERRWQAQVSSEVLAAPQAAEGVVVVRTVDGKLTGLAAEDGAQLWVHDRNVPTLTLRGTAPPVLRQGMVLTGFDDGTLVALALEDAQLLWESQVAMPSGRSDLERMVDIDAAPVITGNTVYAATYQGSVAGLDLDSGNILWRREISSHAGVAGDVANLYVTDERNHVWALDRFTAASVWRQDQLEAREVTAPAVLGEHVVVGDLEGYVHWLRRDDGAFAARVRVDGSPIRAAPIAAGETLYVYSHGGNLAALRPALQ